MTRIIASTLLATFIAIPAFAQEDLSALEGAESASATRPAPTETIEGEKKLALDEIVVTAQKRSEDVRDVPMAVSVMTGQELRDSAIVNFNELAAYIPNVSINTDWNSLYIRGIGAAEYSQLAEQSVGYFIDGVYLGRIEFLRPGFVDVEQLEVLKGPQGTLFGRNAAAGVINITTGQPSYEWTADGSGSYGSHGTLDLRGASSGPIIDDKLAFRIAASHNSTDGYVENLTEGATLDPRDSTFIRGKLKFDPTDKLSIVASYAWFDFEAGPFGGTEATFLPTEYQALFTTFDPTFETNLDRRGSRTPDGPDAGFVEANIGDGQIASVQIDWEIFGNHTLTSLTSYADYTTYTGGDIDYSGANLVALTNAQEYSQYSEEIRLVSPPGDFHYQVGIFLMHVDHKAEITVPIFPNASVAMLTDPLLVSALSSALGPIIGPIGGTQLVPADDVYGFHDITIDTAAIFGQARWQMLDTLALTVGLRYTYDKKTDNASGRPSDSSVIWRSLVGEGYAVKSDKLDQDVSPKVSLTWEPVEWATLYATYAKGFKAGSYNIAALAAEDVPFDPESAASYEAGIKTELLDGRARFNIAGHWTDFTNLQVATFQTIGYNVTNAPEAVTRGVEGDFSALLLEGLTINLAAAYTDAHHVKFEKGPCPATSPADVGNFPPGGLGNQGEDDFCDLSGKRLLQAPEVSGSARINYRAPIGNTGMLAMIGLDAMYKDDVFYDLDLDPLDSQEAHWMFNAQIGLMDIDGTWSFILRAKNLEDKLIKTRGGDVPVFFGTHAATSNPPRAFLGAFRITL